MADKELLEVTRKLLRDHSFVLWCMTPTEELNAKWEYWFEKHPTEQEAADQARAILKSARLNDYSIPADKSEQMWKRLDNELQLRRRKHRLPNFRYAAACVAVLFLSVTAFWLSERKTDLSDKLLAETEHKIDSTHTEVTLILDNRKSVEVEDNALIAYDTDITVKGKQDEKTIIKNIGDKEEKKAAMNTLVVPKGRRSALLLADGSKVWVNSGSILRFPSTFDSDQRTIEVKGEIYIEVVKSNTPFYVKTDDFTVNVLGTKFNISAYPDDLAGTVVLVEGSVMVHSKSEEKIHLNPGRKLTLEGTKNRIDEVDIYDYISWKDGLLQFRGETMGNILMRLSRYYNVPIKCDPAIAQRRSSGKLVLFDTIGQVMNTFSMLYTINYRIESDTIRIE